MDDTMNGMPSADKAKAAPIAAPKPFSLLRVAPILVAVLVPVILILASVRLVMTEAYLNFEYHRPDFPADYYGFTLEDRLHYAPYAVQYLVNGSGIEFLGDLKMPDGSRFYNDRELAHMVDVKHVVQITYDVLAGAVALVVIMGAVLIRSQAGRRSLRQGLFSGATLMLVLLVGLVVAVLVNWDQFFVQFHELFFADGTWVFEYSDSLIRLFPVRFWQDAALSLGALSAGGAVLILLGTWWWARSKYA